MSPSSTYSSEISVDFQRTTRRYIPEDRTLQKQMCSKACLAARNFFKNRKIVEHLIAPISYKKFKTSSQGIRARVRKFEYFE
jgi:hypothetical protein